MFPTEAEAGGDTTTATKAPVAVEEPEESSPNEEAKVRKFTQDILQQHMIPLVSFYFLELCFVQFILVMLYLSPISVAYPIFCGGVGGLAPPPPPPRFRKGILD